ncbi:MAG: DNA polymerase IV [Christensenellales bacterium]
MPVYPADSRKARRRRRRCRGAARHHPDQNPLAKSFGVKTGEPIWQAKQKCPGLVCVPPDFPLYMRFSQRMRKLYESYSDRVEPFGLDEAWLDLSGRGVTLRDGARIADEIRRRVKNELGITISVGVSFNKVFAKLGSDLHKPDATTLITPQNYQKKIWPLPAEELLFIGRSTACRLHEYGLRTIGDIARSGPDTLHTLLGKNGDLLYQYASGRDDAPVLSLLRESDVKSISNSTTPAFDITDEADARRILYLLCDSIAERMREQELRCRTVAVWIRDTNLVSWERQMQLPAASDLAAELVHASLTLLRQGWDMRRPLRSLGVRGCDLVSSRADTQLTVLPDRRTLRQAALETAIDGIHARFGRASLRRCVMLSSSKAVHADTCQGLSAANMSAIHGHV